MDYYRRDGYKVSEHQGHAGPLSQAEQSSCSTRARDGTGEYMPLNHCLPVPLPLAISQSDSYRSGSRGYGGREDKGEHAYAPSSYYGQRDPELRQQPTL
jgi:hypothetical protein